MNATRLVFAIATALLVSWPLVSAVAGTNSNGASDPTLAPPSLARADVEKIMRTAADWQLAHPSKSSFGDWVQGPFVNGLFALGQIPGNERYLAEVEKMGRQLNWQVIKTDYAANDHCSAQTWLDLYVLKKDPAMLEPTRKALDQFIAAAAGSDESVRFIPKNYTNKWSWCDALYMSPPAFARLGRITGEPKYFDYLDKWWRIFSKTYYDTNEHLFYRDHTWLPTNSVQPKVFWARGNGWVAGGLVRVLEELPQDDPRRPLYEQQLRDMCKRLLELQQPDGLWTANLLNPQNPPGPESSGSGFFIYALAYASNQGIIEGNYKSDALRAWVALTKLLNDDGKLTHVQPIGDSPKSFAPNTTVPYGVGAFLLAGSEIWRLAH